MKKETFMDLNNPKFYKNKRTGQISTNIPKKKMKKLGMGNKKIKKIRIWW